MERDGNYQIYGNNKMKELISIRNFYPGPSVLPNEVLVRAQAELFNYQGLGLSIIEMSHRSVPFDELMNKVEKDLRKLMGIPNDYAVLFLQGGASLQFGMVPINLLPQESSADYIVNGIWGQKAAKEANKVGKVRVAASTEDTNFDRLPVLQGESLDSEAAYLHFTSNETINGVQWNEEPTPPVNIPLVCDMSSDILSKPIEVAKYGLIYAGAQKNVGSSGVTIVIIREDLLERVPDNLPAMLDFRLLAKKRSLHNTPPSFSIYIVSLVLEWLIKLGGVDAITKSNQQKASMIYEAIDESNGFYRGTAQKDCRSIMNVTFRLTTDALEDEFCRQAEGQGLIGLRGHRSVGGLRASIYNACPIEAVQDLVNFMLDFQNQFN
jgi:phosphoserine aminotransferase